MKKIRIFTTLTFIALVFGAALINSCSKQEMTDQAFTQNQEVVMSAADINFQNNLIRFKDKVEYIRENPQFKSGEVMSVDSAVYLMEALFNYTYGYPEETYSRSKTDTGYIVLQLDNDGNIPLEEINLKFTELTNKVSNFYYNCGFEDKGLILTGLEQESVVGNELTIMFYSITGNKGNSSFPFEEGDDWWYGFDLGKCDNIPGSDTTDAAELIESYLGISYILPPPPPGYRYTYVPDDPITLEGNEYPNPESPTPNDNYTDYLMYYATEAADTLTDEVKCLEHEEMNFYVLGGMEIIGTLLPQTYNNPSNWLFMSCDYNDKTEWIDNDEVIRHEGVFNYSYRYLVPESQDPRITL